MLGVVMWLDGTVPYPEYEGEEQPCIRADDDELVCPEPAPLKPETPLRRNVTFLASEAVSAPFSLLGLLLGVGLSITAMIRARKTRHSNAQEMLAFRIALAGVLILVAIPLVAGLVLLVLLMSFRIRG